MDKESSFTRLKTQSWLLPCLLSSYMMLVFVILHIGDKTFLLMLLMIYNIIQLLICFVKNKTRAYKTATVICLGLSVSLLIFLGVILFLANLLAVD